MRLLLCCALLQVVLADPGLFKSYLGKSQLCQPWACIQTKLGFGDILPPRDQVSAALTQLLPEGAWQDAIPPALDVCYGDAPRRYTNTCPGQALWHCVIDNLSENCPEESLLKDDACAPTTSLAGLNYMFSQSRYEKFAKNLPIDKRPVWFLKNYFSSKCCRLPTIFNSTLLSECKFSTMMRTYLHVAVKQDDVSGYSSVNIRNQTKTITFGEKTAHDEIADPIDCCDMSSFTPTEARRECDFKLSWDELDRLNIHKDPVLPTTPSTVDTSEKGEISNDVKVIPVSCEAETCVFRKLNIIDDQGSVDIHAFSKLLDNMTATHPEWKKAKARVITKCLSKPISLYEDDCEINKVLACTFDVLSENCPHAKSKDHCKHSQSKEDVICQISSSKYRPKNRRQFCGFPSLVSHKLLSQCGINSISHMQYVPVTHASKAVPAYRLVKHSCKELTNSTKCLLNKMGVLNKYGFMDYFKMKERIRLLTNDASWSPFLGLYESAFLNLQMYGDHCNSPKRLLNVLDVMLMTCPVSKRRNTSYCSKIFDELRNAPTEQKETLAKTEDHHGSLNVLPMNHISSFKLRPARSSSTEPPPKIVKNPTFDFGILNSNAPQVEILDIKRESSFPSKQSHMYANIYPEHHKDPTLRIFKPHFESPQMP